jgi:hypothetical protein
MILWKSSAIGKEINTSSYLLDDIIKIDTKYILYFLFDHGKLIIDFTTLLFLPLRFKEEK